MYEVWGEIVISIRVLKSSLSYAPMPCSAAYSLIALASGWALFVSSEYASFKRFSSPISSVGITSQTFGSPFVIVPVLSRATILILPASSSAAAFLKRIPFLF